MNNQIMSEASYLSISNCQIDACGLATTAEPGEVISPTVKRVADRAAQVGDRSAHHETGVVERKLGLIGREERTVKIRERLGHASRIVPLAR
jgi:hypothetical protein